MMNVSCDFFQCISLFVQSAGDDSWSKFLSTNSGGPFFFSDSSSWVVGFGLLPAVGVSLGGSKLSVLAVTLCGVLMKWITSEFVPIMCVRNLDNMVHNNGLNLRLLSWETALKLKVAAISPSNLTNFSKEFE